MAEVTGMTPDRISQEITKETTNLKTYVNSNLSRKADTTYVDTGLSKKAGITYVDTGLSKKADITYVDTGLSEKADITYVDSIAPLKSFVGSGFPEGKVSAPVGSIYTDAEATTGAIRWVKTSGTGNTGWVVEYGDTGLRELFSANNSDFITSGRILVRRIGNTIFLYVSDVQFTKSTPGFGALPVGIKGESAALPGQVTSGSWPTPDGSFAVSTLGYLNFYRVPTDKTVNALLTYSTSEAWPTSRPGSPA